MEEDKDSLQEEVVRWLSKKYSRYTYSELMTLTSSYFDILRNIMRAKNADIYRMRGFGTFWVHPRRWERILLYTALGEKKRKRLEREAKEKGDTDDR